MTTMESLKYNLANLHRFSGRDAQLTFWPYAFTIFFTAMGLSFLVMIPWFVETMARMQRYAAEHPENVQVTSGPGHYEMRIENGPPELFGDMAVVTRGMAVIFLLAAVLLAAAVARRLHDRERSGIWGLPPVAFVLVATVMMPKAFADPLNTRLFMLSFLTNFAYIASLALLVLLLVRSSVPGPNRYGDPP